uniref:GNBP1 n=1 Tax=Tenebrio molitor TaxID=7067 RepID=B1B5K2_TENMO|nr:GNBP1 [Tenebrio molitor]
MFAKAIILFLILTTFQCHGEFVIPEVTLEAYEPKGFRASIPALNGIQMFAFHGNINKPISQVDPGEYSQDYTSPTGNTWSYFNKDLKLKAGDVIHYWVFIQFLKLGYRKDNQVWNVTELVQLKNSSCETSPTTVRGRSVICKNSIIFEENFNGEGIDTKKWLIEQYIPTYTSLDYEFVSYQNDPTVCFLNDNKLFIKPKYAQSEAEVNGELDFRNRCTRKTDEECYKKREIYFIIPPVTSGRLVSDFRFKYGKVEIRAKLPAGDWIYPQMYLEQVNDPKKKIWIGYARGNNKLLANNQEDIGGNLLFGGPVLDPEEPHRSQYLKSTRNSKPFTSQMHTLVVLWDEDHISLQLNGIEYGKIDKRTMQEVNFADNDMVRLVLGVGVGGVNDFPDDFRSGTNVKPWRNKDNKQVKNFFTARSEWGKTWSGDNCALQVDYIKVWAL